MSNRLKRAAVAIVVVVGAAQLVRPDRVNPATDATEAIEAHLATSSRFGAVVDRACRDCHTNRTVWPWYTRVAPVSWAMAYGVRAGRQAVNFSEWGAYEPRQQRILLAESCQDVLQGKMPGPWTWLHPEAKLSTDDIETICAAARQAPVTAARGF